ncbi:hypothetical protein KM043_007553 [Ampulex compressa]|nr:hypothetical protein KM043_007553 [Ampulex compressa]
MPFMIGRAPIRRTLQYLEAGKLYLKNNIQIFTINYNTHGDHHKGCREFVFWHLSQIQYKNPKVQVITFKNITPTPFIKCYYSNGNTMLIDVDNRNNEDIMNHLLKVVGKSEQILQQESIAKTKKENPASFGQGCSKACICLIPGQVPCTGTIPLPKHMRGKYKFAKE